MLENFRNGNGITLKVGDKIRATKDGRGYYKAGSDGEVIRVDGDRTVKVHFKTDSVGDGKWYLYANTFVVINDEAPVNSFGFKVGDKFKVITEDSFRKGEIVTLTHDDGTDLPGFTGEDDEERYEYYSYLELIPSSDPVEIAKANLAKAQAELKAAEDAKAEETRKAAEAEQAAKKFTARDLKCTMIVEIDGDLRLVTFNRSRTIGIALTQSGGEACHWEKSDSSAKTAEEWLNSNYTKSTKTLKDFANA
jgi:hypothetical protein